MFGIGKKNKIQKNTITKSSTSKVAKNNVSHPCGNKPIVLSKQKVKEEFPHFRFYMKSQHPAMIVGEHVNDVKEEEYKYRKVMHTSKDGRHLNEEVRPNPNFKDTEPMYIARRVKHDNKNQFGSKYPWKYPKNSIKKK